MFRTGLLTLAALLPELAAALVAPRAANATSPKSSWFAFGPVQDEEPTMADLLYADNMVIAGFSEDPSELPEQGYTGKPVAHTNMKSATGNWTKEYGPTDAPVVSADGKRKASVEAADSGESKKSSRRRRSQGTQKGAACLPRTAATVLALVLAAAHAPQLTA
mmetsp:Transcript_31023/g.60891  ORF Transcript_31023/g.60891 Transcript_31023/m.60891 type:complete len:163 (-) Transcript_31023:61-549(-)